MSFVTRAGQKAVSRVSESLQARRDKHEALRPRLCLNCGAEALKFCPECGQENNPYAIYMGEQLRDIWDEFIKMDNRIVRTMIPLLFRPGYLTKQYAEGKRVRYLSPFRLYLVVSALFFYLLSQHAPVTSSADDMTLGQQIAQWREDAQTKEKAARKSPGAKPTSNTKHEIEQKGISVNFSDEDIASVRTVQIWKRTIDLYTVPDTLAKYEAQQKKLDPAKRDDSITRWTIGRIIAAKSLTKRSYFEHLLATTPKVLFVMMPLFALMLKVLYLRSRRLYVEHFILALHIHTVYFVLSGIALLVPILALLVPPVLAFYSFWSMRTLYGQGIGKTFVKWTLLSWNYGFALLLGGILALFLSFVI